MAETVMFRGAILRRFESPPTGETTPFCRSHWTVDFAEPSNGEMGWKDPGDCGVTGADLIGEFAAANIIVTPHDPQLTKHELDIDAHEVTDFKLHTVKDEESTRREVRFIVRSNVEGVAAMLENYRWRVGDRPALMKISYVKQQNLDLGEEKELELNPAPFATADESGKLTDSFGPPEGPCVFCNNKIGWQDWPNCTTHITGQKCMRWWRTLH